MPVKIVSRKDKRKQAKVEKKEKHLAFFQSRSKQAQEIYRMAQLQAQKKQS